MRFKGTSNTIINEFPNLSILKCKNKDYCKSEDEIEIFLNEVVLTFILTTDVYHTEDYENLIEKSIELFTIELESGNQ